MRAVELLAGDVRGEFGQLGAVAGRGHADPVHMVVEVEFLVLDPHRMAEIPERIVQFAAERRNHQHALGEALLELPERVAAGNGRTVEGHQPADVQNLGGRLQVEEARVESAQFLHADEPKPLSRAFASPRRR